MPDFSNRRPHRLLAPVLAGVMAIALLGGCTGQRDPDSYTSGVKESFLEGCEKTAAADAGSEEATGEIDDAKSFCECAYDKISDEDDGVPFGDFKAANSELIDANPDTTIPKVISDAFASCTEPR